MVLDPQLETLLLAANAPAQVLAAFQGHAADRKALLFTPTVALAYAMAATFQAAGIPYGQKIRTIADIEQVQIEEKLYTLR